ncbi:Hypothetical protein i Rubrerythrin cluster [Grimontia indica]|uniref:DUF3501 domain-containing protein n=1 Tax=Grimontia indica TaxID=1056512 RepID=R1IVY0_9GAMM|nr:DUF3501 family protein [Grimontia indica]EOD81637.1 Hypothetical protein i Rubrerythrin cluster [Grimontia indica]
MEKLTADDLMTLEDYARARAQFRHQIMEHKKHRFVKLGDHARLIFENRQTIQYQIQEMLRIERIFEPEGIEEELDAYNPLIPDGSNLKATMMIEYADPEIRKVELAKLIGVENKVWLRVGNDAKVYPICDEDLERDNDEKTSSVHFMRFELTPPMITALKKGDALTAGVDHPALELSVTISDEVRNALSDDLDTPQIN